MKKILKTKLLINGRIGNWTQFCLILKLLHCSLNYITGRFIVKYQIKEEFSSN